MSTTSDLRKGWFRYALTQCRDNSTVAMTDDEITAEWGLVRAARLSEMERENARLREMFALLPKTASEAMISAAEDAASDHFAIDGDKGAWLREDGYKAIWQAMTVAALAGSGEK